VEELTKPVESKRSQNGISARTAGDAESERSNAFHQLCERENQVFALAALGASNATIARALHLSEGSVRNTVARVIHKLGVDDRTQALLLCYRTELREVAAEPPPLSSQRQHIRQIRRGTSRAQLVEFVLPGHSRQKSR
jgi:DNA-binding CsgD family transcriptional regulator